MQKQSIKSTLPKLLRPCQTWKVKPEIMNPATNFLTLMACHTNSIDKMKAAISTLRYVRFKTNKLVVINSSDSALHDVMERWLKKNMPHVEYYSIPNATTLDAGKWHYYLTTHYKPQYDWVVFTNDSFITTHSLYHYYNLMARSAVELYGYNDSSQITYHYQSYLFGMQKTSVHKFISHFEKVKPVLRGYMDVVKNIELMLTHIVARHDCFLHIASLPGHVGQNIFLTNDSLYTPLLRTGVLPFYKLRRMRDYHKHKKRLINASTRLTITNGIA